MADGAPRVQVLFDLARKTKELHDAMEAASRQLAQDPPQALEGLLKDLAEGWGSLAADAGIEAVSSGAPVSDPPTSQCQRRGVVPATGLPSDGVYPLADGGCGVVIRFNAEERSVAYGRAFSENIDEGRQKSLYSHLREWLQSWLRDGAPASCDPNHPSDLQAEIADLRRKYPLKTK